jgi:hypothetical protein
MRFDTEAGLGVHLGASVPYVVKTGGYDVGPGEPFRHRSFDPASTAHPNSSKAAAFQTPAGSLPFLRRAR